MHEFLFGVYPYICLVIFSLGLLFRYMATPGEWNARSSNLFAKKSLLAGSFLFHYAIIFVFFGHVIGLLIPAWLLGSIGISGSFHLMVAKAAGQVMAPCVFIGLLILLLRRILNKDIWAATVPMDVAVIIFIMIQALSGGCQDFMGHTDVLAVVGPWVRGILGCQPDPQLMADVPARIKLHVICAFTIFAMIPFSRLVHFFSLPLTWFARPLISYRRRYENL